MNEVIVFHQPVGWGYKIKYQKKIIIIQQNIPAVNGNISFRSKKDAKKTGSLVLIKMIKNPKTFPEINTKELDSLGISYE